MAKLVILHFSAPEQYPPLQNFLQLLDGDARAPRTWVYSTALGDGKIPVFKIPGKKVSVCRLAVLGREVRSARRWWNYLKYYLGSLLLLVRHQPEQVLYYESLSSWPAYIYKRYVNPRARLFIHYHEYNTPGDYRAGMALNRFFHRREKWLYPRAEWVSHTNPQRLRLFEEDIAPIVVRHPYVWPNYPPQHWYHLREKAGEKEGTTMLRLVYVGAVSLETMYMQEVADWVKGQQGKVTWHIYSPGVSPETRKALEGASGGTVKFFAGVAYAALPAILNTYDTGLILYKGHTANYIWNEPNKLFEYLACGLAVWYPPCMTGISQFHEQNPQLPMQAVAFDKLGETGPAAIVNKPAKAREAEAQFTCEAASREILDKLRA